MTDSQQLLREYVKGNSESAFGELVRRYVDLVYSTALRRTDNDTRIAEDIAQTVFTDLARKARTLPADVMLGGWLHQHTCFVAANVVRGEQRRRVREQQALEMNMLHDDPEENWKQLAPVLDEAIQELAPAERDAIVLRFFEKRDFRSVGAALGISDDTAQKRVSRALEKLRGLLVQRGITMGVVALGTALADRSLQAAPESLPEAIANSIPQSPAANKLSPVIKGAVALAIVALLLTVILHPAVFGRIRGLLNPSNASAANQQSVFDELPQPEPGGAGNAGTISNVPAETTVAQVETPSSTNVLNLVIVADDSGKPVPNVPLDIRYRSAGRWKTPKLTANRVGVCEVILPDKLSELDITTRIEGFADTRLVWNVERGETIPSTYLLKLIRPTRIGGRVVNPEGQPVSGAKVGFNHHEDPSPTASPESHRFSWIETTTDSEGRWQINRIAPEMIRRIHGTAKHPDYAMAQIWELEKHPEIEKQLIEGKHLFQLGKTLTIRGTVESSDGHPIANAKVIFGRVSNSDRRETNSFPDGTFIIRNVKLGKNLLSAEADGYAVTTQNVQITSDDQVFKLILNEGKTLRMRVVNPEGTPIPNASIWLNTIQPYAPDNRHIVPVQKNLQARTDQEGRYTWDNAPDQELLFGIRAAGYMRESEAVLRPGPKEHTIKLGYALNISGTVRDASTGVVVPKFRVIFGWPDSFGKEGAHWSSFDRDWLTFEGGRFQKRFEEALILGMENPGYVLKIEAEGYTPYVSRTFKPDEREVQLDIQLNPAHTPLITVLLPEGQAAANADVGFVYPGARLEMMSGAFARDNANHAALSQTDRRGQFRLSGDDRVFRVVIAHPQGCAEVSPGELSENSVIRLQPWGRLEGTYRSAGKPVEGREFTIEFGFAKQDSITYAFRHKVATDAEGKFVFPKLLPGTHELMMFMPHKGDDGTTSFPSQRMQQVVIEAGQTSLVELGNTGYKVITSFEAPVGNKKARTHIMAHVHTPYPIPPVEIQKDAAALQEWRARPDIAAQLELFRTYPLTKLPDGTWTAENLPPGDYKLSVNISRMAEGNAGTGEGWFGGADVSIPAEPASGVINLGRLELQKIPSN